MKASIEPRSTSSIRRSNARSPVMFNHSAFRFHQSDRAGKSSGDTSDAENAGLD